MNTEGQQKYLNVTVLSRLEYWASQRTDRGLLFWKIPYNDVLFISRNYQTSSNANNVLFSYYTINKKTFRRFFYILTFQMNKAVTILWSVPSFLCHYIENASHTVITWCLSNPDSVLCDGNKDIKIIMSIKFTVRNKNRKSW